MGFGDWNGEIEVRLGKMRREKRWEMIGMTRIDSRGETRMEMGRIKGMG